MRLIVPDQISHPYWEGALEFPVGATPQRVRSPASDVADTPEPPDPRELPVVSMGRPQVWRLEELYEHDQMPPQIRSSVERDDFHVVQLSCSFRPRGKTLIEWARFVVSLSGDGAIEPLIADLHPIHVRHEARKKVRVGLNPRMKFQDIEVGLGEAAFELEYAELQPVVSGSGAGESRADWSYSEAKGIRLDGSKWMHLLVRSPRNAGSCVAKLDLLADLAYRGWRMPAFRPRPTESGADPLTIQLWG